MRRSELVNYVQAQEQHDAISESFRNATKGAPTVMTETRYEHIMLTDDSVPMIVGAKMKVVELVLDHIAYGWSPEELHFQHPNLTMGQIHSALAYYWDHKAEMDEDIERGLQAVDELRKTVRPSPLIEKLKLKRSG